MLEREEHRVYHDQMGLSRLVAMGGWLLEREDHHVPSREPTVQPGNNRSSWPAFRDVGLVLSCDANRTVTGVCG
jgi:hypothetical protein